MPLLWLSLAFLCGLAVASEWSSPDILFPALLVLGVASGAAGLALRRHRGTGGSRSAWLGLPVGFLLAAFALGGMRAIAARPAQGPGSLSSYAGQGSLLLEGNVDSQPQRTADRMSFNFRVSTLQPGDQTAPALPVSGLVLVEMAPSAQLSYGDQLTLQGVPLLAQSPAYASTLQRQGLDAVLSYPRVLQRRPGSGLLSAIYALRQRAYDLLQGWLPQPEASFASGVLLGMDQAVPAELQRAFEATGTSHIMAISGFNVALVAGVLILLLGRLLGPRRTFLLAVPSLVFYTLLVGADPSVVRAAIMACLGLFGQLFGRRQTGTNTLAFVAALMAAYEPRVLWDVGFQLSFMATLGLVLFGDPLARGFEGWAEKALPSGWAARLVRPVSEYLLITLAAQATTLPLILYHFQRLSLSSLLVNPLILPAQTLVMALGGLALAAGLVLPQLGQPVAWLAWPPLAYTTHLVEAFGAWSWGSVGSESFGLGALLASYALLTLAWQVRGRWAGVKAAAVPTLAATLVAIAAVAVWQQALHVPDGNLHVGLYPGTSAAAVLVRSPAGATLLVPADGDAEQCAAELAGQLPLLERSMDGVLLTQAKGSALNAAAALLNRYPPQRGWWAVEPPASGAGEALGAQLRDQGAIVGLLSPGHTLSLDGGATVEVLATDQGGLAWGLSWGRFRLLVPGGLKPSELRSAGAEWVWEPSGVLLGAADLKDDGLQAWQATRPEFIYMNGLEPQDEASSDARIFNGASVGWLELETDGESLRLSVEKR